MFHVFFALPLWCLFSSKVTIMEDPDQNVHLKNLSLQQSANEEEDPEFEDEQKKKEEKRPGNLS